MPTIYPKCTPSEVQGLLVLLNSHNGAEDVALLADDLDLEIDEILPSVEFAEALQLVKVVDGRATLTDAGRRYLAASIRERKTILRDQLKRTTLFRTLLRALENAPSRTLTDDALSQIISVTAAQADEAVQNIVNWGRYVELFRYDADEHLVMATAKSPPRGGGGSRPPSAPTAGAPGPKPASRASARTADPDPPAQTRPLVAFTA